MMKWLAAGTLIVALGALGWAARAAAESGEQPALSTAIFEVEGMTCGGPS